MSADTLGGRLLAEVQQEGLLELFSDLRKLAEPQPSNVLGLPQVDRLLEAFRIPVLPPVARWTSPVPDGGTSPSSVGQVTPARGHIATSPGGSRTRPSVIQLSNSSSAAGTSSLCCFLTTLAVLPQDYGGKRHGVVWLDADGRFSATRLESVLINYLSTKFPKLSSRESNTICHEAFQHVHIFRPQSSAQLVSTLASLPGYLLGTSGSTTHLSATWSMGLVILDSATAFYWQDRFEFEIARLESLGSGENSGARSPARPSGTLATISELRKLQKLFDCTIVFTSTPHMKTSAMTTSVVPAIATNDGRLLPQEPPGVSPWTAFATLNLSVFQEQVRPFAAQMSLEECQRDQPKRLVAVAKGRAIVSVDWNTSDTWPGGVRDAVNRLDGQGSFAMRITSSGIAVED